MFFFGVGAAVTAERFTSATGLSVKAVLKALTCYEIAFCQSPVHARRRDVKRRFADNFGSP